MKDRFPGWRGDLEWRGRWAGLSARYPADPSYAQLEARMRSQPGHGYHLSSEVEAALDGNPDPARRQTYLYGFLLWQIGQFDRRFVRSGYPTEIEEHYADSFHRIMDGIEGRSIPSDLRKDLFVKDLSLTRLVLIPAVSRVLYPGSGIPLRPLAGWPSGWAYVFGRCGGRSPYFEAHTHDAMVESYFNPAGWEETFRLTALLLKKDPGQRGFIVSSWLYDPKLADVSPRLAYLHDIPKAGGARFLRMGPDQDSAQLATAKSPTRRAAYETGSYLPSRYWLIWSRADLLEHYG